MKWNLTSKLIDAVQFFFAGWEVLVSVIISERRGVEVAVFWCRDGWILDVVKRSGFVDHVGVTKNVAPECSSGVDVEVELRTPSKWILQSGEHSPGLNATLWPATQRITWVKNSWLQSDPISIKNFKPRTLNTAAVKRNVNSSLEKCTLFTVCNVKIRYYSQNTKTLFFTTQTPANMQSVQY